MSTSEIISTTKQLIKLYEDYSKTIKNKIKIFEELLENHSKYISNLHRQIDFLRNENKLSNSNTDDEMVHLLIFLSYCEPGYPPYENCIGIFKDFSLALKEKLNIEQLIKDKNQNGVRIESNSFKDITTLEELKKEELCIKMVDNLVLGIKSGKKYIPKQIGEARVDVAYHYIENYKLDEIHKGELKCCSI